MQTPPDESVEKLKQGILSAIREQWEIPELQGSQVKKVRLLSHGWRSQVVLASLASDNNNQAQIAVKTFNEDAVRQLLNDDDKKKKVLLYFAREAAVWRKIGTHENIAGVYAFMKSFDGSSLPAIVSPFYSKGDLRRYVSENKVPYESRIALMLHVARGLEYLHSSRIVHRDIRGSNILVKEDQGTLTACISDFGSSKFLDRTDVNLSYTTEMPIIVWSPPEYIKGGAHGYSSPTTHGDIWSFGITLLEIMKGSNPWGRGENPKEFLMLSRPPRRPKDIQIGDDLWSIMTLCWQVYPPSRIDARGLVIYLEKVLR